MTEVFLGYIRRVHYLVFRHRQTGDCMCRFVYSMNIEAPICSYEDEGVFGDPFLRVSGMQPLFPYLGNSIMGVPVLAVVIASWSSESTHGA